MDMWTEGYDDAWASLAPEHPEDEEYMRGYADAEYDMEEDAFEDFYDEPVEDSD